MDLGQAWAVEQVFGRDKMFYCEYHFMKAIRKHISENLKVSIGAGCNSTDVESTRRCVRSF